MGIDTLKHGMNSHAQSHLSYLVCRHLGSGGDTPSTPRTRGDEEKKEKAMLESHKRLHAGKIDTPLSLLPFYQFSTRYLPMKFLMRLPLAL